MDILPRELTLKNISRYEDDVADPASVYKDPAFRTSYLKMHGNICFDIRENFVNFSVVFGQEVDGVSGAAMSLSPHHCRAARQGHLRA